MNIGKAIKLIRNTKSISLSEVAKDAGCSVSYLSLLENSLRDPSIATVESIAKALNVPISILFFLAADPDELENLTPELSNQLSKMAVEFLARQ